MLEGDEMTENQNELKPSECHKAFEKWYEEHQQEFIKKIWEESGEHQANIVVMSMIMGWKAAWNTRATSPADRQIEAIRAAMAECRRAWPDRLRYFYTEIEKILEEGK